MTPTIVCAQRARAALAGLLFAGAIWVPLSGAAQELVYVEGAIESMSQSIGPSASQMALVRAELCAPGAGEKIADAMSALSENMGPLLSLAGPAGAAATADAYYAASAAAAQLCEAEEEPPEVVGFFRIVYATCRLTMYQGAAVVDMRLPPGEDRLYFDMIDYAGNEVVSSPVDIADVLRGTTSAGQSSGTVTSTGNSGTYVTPSLNVDTVDYRFETSFTMDIVGMMSAFGGADGAQLSPDDLAMMQQFIGAPEILSNGTASIAADAPGIDTVRAFYQNFSAVLSSGQGTAALMSGLFNHHVLEKGMPMEMKQTTEVVIRSPVGGIFGGIGLPDFARPQAETTTTKLSRILLLPMPDGYCGGSIVPEGFTVTNPLPGPSPSSNPPPSTTQNVPPGSVPASETSVPGASSEEAAAAMRELNEALAGMSEEDRAAMQSLGAGFGQLLGGLAGNGAANARPGTPASIAPPARVSSANLMTDDLTQSAQNLLEALGYEPGNTDGELSTQTVIAISQFQAERGLTVTGAVTPQLVGVLAAEVDR